MKRIVSSVAAVAASLWLTSAGALGLGEIEVRSHLNQRFDAIIPLTSTSAEEAADLRVGVADPADFARAGLEPSDYLSSLRFAVRTDGATPRIEVSSDKLEREPFVQMLLEVHSGGNRILRQYTVLLDPPGVAQQTAPLKPVPVAPAAAIVPQKNAVDPAPVFVEVEHPAPPPDERVSAPRAEPVAEAAPAPAAPIDEPATGDHLATAPASGELYGPVKPAETLWSIATRVRGNSDLTMDQVLLALYNSNPRAFDGNINGLSRGAMLRIPTADDMRATDAAAAHLEVARLRGLPAGGAAASTPRAHRPVIEPAKITPPPPPAATVAATETTTPAAASETTAPATPAAPTADTKPAETNDAATAPADAAAAPTTEGSATNADGAQTPAAPATADANGAAAPEPSATPDADAAVASEPEPEAAPAAKAHDEPGLLGTLLIPLMVGLLVLLVIAWLYSRWRARRAAPPPAPVVAPKRMPLRSAAVAGAAAAGAAGAASAAASTQKLSPQEELDRLQASLSEATRDDIPTQQVPPNTQQIDTAGAEQTQAVAADLPPVDFDLTGQFATQTVQIDLDANDPVSEADFHLAYGLYDEAALLLRQAAEKEPERTDIGIKLAETYFAAGKVADFERTAVELKPKLAAADWQKLAIMGQQLDPGSSLFGDAAQAPTESAAAAPAAADPVLDFNFDAEEASAAPATQPVPAMTMRADNGLDFKLDDLELPSLDLAKNEAPASAQPEAVDGNTLDFDLGSFDTPAETPAEPAAPAAPAASEHDASAAVDFDLGEFDTPAAPTATEAPAAAEAPIEEFDFDTVSADASDIAGDEASTKLDLARAYVEMGDHEMARGLLDEVLAQGNTQQKQDAQALIARLA